MEPVGFFGIFEESRRIITAHSRHFLGLSVLFLLPIAFLTCAASTFRNWINVNEGHEELLRSTVLTYSNHGDDDDNKDFFLAYTRGLMETKVVLLLSLYGLLMFGLALCSNAAVTHSTCNGFYGRGVKLPGAIKSIPGSAWRLLLTSACGMAVLVGISFTFGLLLSLVLLDPLDPGNCYTRGGGFVGIGTLKEKQLPCSRNEDNDLDEEEYNGERYWYKGVIL
ncbi:hypothetical protein SUGI_0998510 [Cryptomeria japonica]|nr:hypothetical protein SUGI_0998510 [Cryptomeria japonica]